MFAIWIGARIDGIGPRPGLASGRRGRRFGVVRIWYVKLAGFERQAEAFDDRLSALSDCIQQLPDDGRSLIKRRYADGWSVKNLADELGQTANRLAVRLHRLRSALMECIQRRCPGGEVS